MTHTLVWFRNDLRLGDNPAWGTATHQADRATALFVLDPGLWEGAGDHRRNQLAAHLRALDEALAASGGRLRMERGDPAEVVPRVAAAIGAESVHWNGDVSPYAVRRDAAVAARVPAVIHEGRWVHGPGTVVTAAGEPYRVFTPFYRTWFRMPRPRWAPAGSAAVADHPGGGIPEAGEPPQSGGEVAARSRLQAFLARIDRYDTDRDRPDLEGTARISADLKFGTLDPRAVADRAGAGTPGRDAFVRQLAWRDFYAQVLAAFPHSRRGALRPEYDRIAWRRDPGGLDAWRSGQTGYPLVDAGMRQLAASGWMHNRVRMITASFLVKDLLIDWREGERHFLHLLIDGDPAQNAGNWQWVAGTGADAAPYFRVFNPVTQSRRFDPRGDYVRRWVPELAGLGDRWIHAPWEAPASELAAAGVILGETYPPPIVDHAAARERTLAAYAAARVAQPS